jgi:hypothetical protein
MTSDMGTPVDYTNGNLRLGCRAVNEHRANAIVDMTVCQQKVKGQNGLTEVGVQRIICEVLNR